MKKAVLFAFAAGTALLALSPAEAREGCGRGGHRGPAGHCRPNVRPGYGGPVLIIGNHYPGRGYWDGRRYWQNRYRYHGGWRYR